MKRSILAAMVLAFCGLVGASAQAAPVSQQAGIISRDGSAVQQVQWGYGHNRWRSHRRWGSGGGGGGDWHNRWRSHRRWGSGGY